MLPLITAAEQPTIHEGYIAQNMEKKGMIADRCEINRQIRADNKMLRELKAKVAKLTEAVEKSIPIIAETLEAIRNHMIFTQYCKFRFIGSPIPLATDQCFRL